jgi:tryptophanyl-tRNA synthetase
MTRPKRFLSGVQPSGALHLGNYFGAIREHIRLQEQGEAFYFIADYHALTTIRTLPDGADRKAPASDLKQYIFDVAVTYLACGLDPSRAVLFRQSDVPEVCELTWLLMTVTPMADLENATSYRDKIERGKAADAGLFTYPVLMAADILAQDADVVPVGRDQKQHVEMTRDFASKFNRAFKSEVFKLPEHKFGEAPYVPGTDGAKMSKSYGNSIGIFDEGKPLEKAVMGIKTDSLPLEAPKNPDTCTVFTLYKLMATPAEQDALAAKYRAGGMGYGVAKQALLAKINEYFAPMREKRKALMADPGEVHRVLKDGAEKARANARAVLDRARRACGLA